MAGILVDNATDTFGKAMDYYNKALSFLGGPGTAKSIEEARDKGQVVDYTTGATKLSSKDGNAEIYLQKDTIVMATDSTTAMAINDGCIILDGRVHFSNSPNHMYVQGFWKFNEELLTTVPSTLFNPVQTLLFNYPPYVKKASKILKVLSGA